MEGLVNNLDLFMILREQLHSLSNSSKLFQFLQEKINVSEENSAELQKFCTRFCSNINARWERSSRTLAQFIRKNGDWLESAISWPAGIIPEPVDTEQRMFEVCDKEDVENLPPSTAEASTSTFTPRKPFEELSSRQKRRRVDEINKSFSVSPHELNATTIANLRNTGNEDVGKIMHHLLNNPEDLEKVKECLSAKVKSNQYSPDKALSLLVSLKLSRWQYISLREAASENGSDLYPSYYKIKQAKSQCYPGKENVTITEDGAAIKLQALLNLTVSRLLDVIALDLSSAKDLVLISKWGFDGASGQSNYKQKTETDFDDSTIFMASLVPVRLQQSDGTIVWENDRPSSTFYCRPILFKFTKETQSTVVSTKNSIEKEIDELQPSRFSQVEVTHKLIMTMIDGKITSYLSETSSSVCDICKAKPSEMNNLPTIAQREKNEDMYQYGLSSLHAWIRSMECLLHIGNAGAVPQFDVQVVDIPTSSSSGSRIVGGSPTTIQQYPFTVQLVYKSQFKCGGSLLTPTHVLTAAHCFFEQGKSVNRSSLSIRAGTTFLNSGGTLHAVSSVKLHESYKRGHDDNDIAVVYSSTRVDVTRGVARLAKIPKQGRVVPDKAYVTAVGWGATSTQPMTTVLYEVTVQIINQKICQARYRPYNITSNMICAGIDVGGKDACQGDSGGPLIYRGVVVGITSFGVPDCGSRYHPGVYTRVARYTNWIVNTVKNLNTLNNGTGNGTNPASGASTLSSKIGVITLLGPFVFLMLSA